MLNFVKMVESEAKPGSIGQHSIRGAISLNKKARKAPGAFLVLFIRQNGISRKTWGKMK